MDIALSIIGGVILLAGIIGCILPIIPGPPLVYLSLIFVSIAQGWDTFSPAFLIVTGLIALIITIMDYILPSIISKKHGASKAGTWGSLLGMVAGLVVFPPFGMFIGAFAGAILGELVVTKKGADSIKAGWGVFLGIVLSIGIKLGFSGFIAISFFRAVF